MVASCGSAPQPKLATSPSPAPNRRVARLPEPAHIPNAAREILHERMNDHADQVAWMLLAAAVFDDEALGRALALVLAYR